MLVTPVLELFSQEYSEDALNLKEKNPPLIEELLDLYKSVNERHAIEYLHDSLDHLESLLTLFDLGYIDLRDRSNTEILVQLIIKKVIKTLKHKKHSDIIRIQKEVQELLSAQLLIFSKFARFLGVRANLSDYAA